MTATPLRPPSTSKFQENPAYKSIKLQLYCLVAVFAFIISQHIFSPRPPHQKTPLVAGSQYFPWFPNLAHLLQIYKYINILYI